MGDLKVFFETGARFGHRAHILELPGCAIKGRTKERLIDALPQAISSHISWLRSHDEKIIPLNGPGFFVFEERNVLYKNDGYEIRSWFSWDEEVFIETEFLKWLKVITYARNDLSERVMDLPGDILGWKQPLAKRETIREIIEKLINRERWYLSRLKNEPYNLYMPNNSNSLSESLAVSRTKVMSMLYFFFEHDKDHIVEHQQEKWSLKKIMRCILELTLESLKEIDYIASSYWCKYNEGLLLSAR